MSGFSAPPSRFDDEIFAVSCIVFIVDKSILEDDDFMATMLSEVLSPLMVDLWQLDRIRDLFESSFSIDEIADEVNLDPILVREVTEIKYPKL